MTAADSERIVLIIDDSESSVAALEIALGAIPGVEVLFFPSAVEAFGTLHDARKRVSAIVTDIRMPAMDGFELIRRIREDHAHAAIPIIVVTGDTDPETPVRSSELGANAFFTKPCSPAAVRRILEKLLDGSDTH